MRKIVIDKDDVDVFINVPFVNLSSLNLGG